MGQGWLRAEAGVADVPVPEPRAAFGGDVVVGGELGELAAAIVAGQGGAGQVEEAVLG